MIRSSEYTSKIFETERPFSARITIQPGRTAIVVNDEIILGTTVSKPGRMRLLVGHSTLLTVARDSDTPGVLHIDEKGLEDPYFVSMEYLFRGQRVYIGPEYEIAPVDLKRSLATFTLSASHSIRLQTVDGRINYKEFLKNIQTSG